MLMMTTINGLSRRLTLTSLSLLISLSFVVCLPALGAQPSLAHTPRSSRGGAAAPSGSHAATQARARTKAVAQSTSSGPTEQGPGQGLSPQWRAALEQVSADDMRGHLSFLSSDLLEGRKTPSRGLDIAAEYIASQFRRAGLEPAGDDGYFQTANWSLAARDMSRFEMRFANGGAAALPLSAEQASFGFGIAGFTFWPLEGDLSLKDAGVFKVAFGDAGALQSLKREQVAGRVVVTQFPDLPRGDRSRAFQLLGEENAFMARMRELGVPLVVAFERGGAGGGRGGAGSSRLVDPDSATRESPLGNTPTAPLVSVGGADAEHFYESLSAGASPATLTFNAPARTQTPARIRNVAGILRGSDPALKDSYVIVSAHYDHLGVREGCDSKKEDCIYNGANDDGSGTVGVVELASALSKMNPRPRRSILFVTFFGEELGLLGSRYYGRHPVVPLAKTVAQVNLEQIGRTDDSEGPQVGTLAVTGFDYSDVGTLLQQAGEHTGIKVYKHPKNSDAYFSRSDNQSLADAGIPAHTLSVAYEYPDYHAVGDDWSKVDYANMERVVRTIALAAIFIADAAQPPRWNESNQKAAPYVAAWKKLHAR
ncbi:MAG: hypothetical protein QOJ76_2399 [Acidobacteriota bacterium]|nr:hypothetical protein [Acidobacteriota bacterium]